MATARKTFKEQGVVPVLKLVKNSNIITKNNHTFTLKQKLNALLQCDNLVKVQRDELIHIKLSGFNKKILEDLYKRVYIENLYELLITKNVVL
jgi:hypothetical protein